MKVQIDKELFDKVVSNLAWNCSICPKQLGLKDICGEKVGCDECWKRAFEPEIVETEQ